MHIAGDRLGTFRSIADRAFADYCREFGDSTVNPGTDLTGFTVEKGWPAKPSTRDTRVYAILARWPFERTPVATRADLNAFINDARRHNMCDLRLKNEFRDHTTWLESALVPIARADVIVFVAVCSECWRAYCEKHGLSGSEIIDPEDAVI